MDTTTETGQNDSSQRLPASRKIESKTPRASIERIVKLVTDTLQTFTPDQATPERASIIAGVLYRQGYTNRDVEILDRYLPMDESLSLKSRYKQAIVPRDFAEALVRINDDLRVYDETGLTALLNVRNDLTRKDFGVVGLTEDGAKLYIRVHREDRDGPKQISSGESGTRRLNP